MEESLNEENSADFSSEIRNILSGYYDEQKTNWRNSEYTVEDIEKFFTEEYLSSLDEEQYGLLLSRFPSEMATHVTRQGVRDHTGMIEHRAGMGEYSSGFMNILEAGRLSSVVGKFLEGEKQDEALGDYFKWLVGQYREHCPWVKGTDRELIESEVEKLKVGANLVLDGDRNLNWHRNNGGFGDSSALHLAKDVVLDQFYGGETQNEIFFAYPIGHFFADHQFADTSALGVDKNNDIWAWTRDNKGLSLDAGLVFIPCDTPVDRNTGSRYFLDEQMKPKVDDNRLIEMTNLINNDEFTHFLEEVYQKFDEDWKKAYELQENFASDLRNRFSISDRKIIRALQGSVDNYQFRKYLLNEPDMLDRTASDFAGELLESACAYYQESEDRIPSKEYWESYFANNPEKKPNKVVYYNSSPTKALENWMWDHGLKIIIKRGMMKHIVLK